MIPNSQLSYNSEHRFRHENLPFDIDEWYPILEQITFKTFFLPLKMEQAEAMIAYYRSFCLRRNDLQSSHTLILEDLEKQIDNLFSSNPALNRNGAFLRLCGRSPKDGDPYKPLRFFQEYKNNLEKISKEKNLDKSKGNTKVMAISKTHWLVVRNGKECLSLLLSSERVYLDLIDWKRFGGKEQIVLREWNPDLDYDNEYRAFVYNNKLTAITQYDHYGKYDEVIESKEIVEKMIQNFWHEQVKPRMKISDYIVDFGYVNNSIILIELSPFLECTGASLYRWPLDGHELRFGDGKLKVALKEYPHVDELAEQWEQRWIDIPDFKQNYVKESWKEWFNRYLSYFSGKKDDCIYIFVGSVLKKGFWWNKKYLSYAEFVDEGELCGYSVFIDQNGMGWIIPGDKLKGELWKVSSDDFKDIEYFYGFCQKVEVEIKTSKDEYKKVVCFIRNDLNKEKGKIVYDYTIDDQKLNYNSMAHSICQQEKYMNCSFKFPLNKK